MGKAWAIVEAKANRISISSKVAAQCVQYASLLGIRWCVVSNGQTWEIYDAWGKGDLAEKKLAAVRLEADETSVSNAWNILSLMSRESVARGLGPETLVVDRIIIEELGAAGSGAIRELRRAIKDRTQDTATPSAIVSAIARLAGQGSLGSRDSARSLSSPQLVKSDDSQVAPASAAVPPSVEEKGRRVRLTHLLAAGLLASGDRLSAHGRDGVVIAVVTRSAQVEIDGRSYANLIDASRAVGVPIVGARAAWEAWRRLDGESMLSVRERFVSTAVSIPE